jgi:hypothetical protein
MDAFLIVGFLQSGLWWIATGVSLLWIFRRIDDAAAVRLLAPVLLLLAVCSAVVTYSIGMELFVAHYSGASYEIEAMQVRLNGPYWWAYWLLGAAHLAPLAFLVPMIRRSMLFVAGISLPCFTVIFAGRLIEMVAGKAP